VLAIVSGVVLLAGFLTPVAGAILGMGYLADCIALLFGANANKYANAFAALYLAAVAAAVAMLGPGAYSADARLFGRVEIIIPEGRRPTRDD
jgi:uncharacterized membrane protein YphA (DoxX/SURF4 family)